MGSEMCIRDSLGVDPETRAVGFIIEEPVSEVSVERRSFVHEVGLDDVDAAVVIVVRRRHAHAALLLPGVTVRNAGFDRDVGERSVAIVAVEQAWCGIAGDVDVRPAVIVEVGHDDTQAVMKPLDEDAGFGGDILETAAQVR